MIAPITVHDFRLLIEHDIAHELQSFSKMAARATAARARDSKHQSNHCRTKPAASSKNQCDDMICYCLKCPVEA